jgi:two-component system, NtrC family, sensor kinase
MPERQAPPHEFLKVALDVMKVLANDESRKADSVAMATIAGHFNATTAVISKRVRRRDLPDQGISVSGDSMAAGMSVGAVCTGYLVLNRPGSTWSAEEGGILLGFAELLAPVIASREGKRRKLSAQKKRLASLLLQERRLVDLTNGSPEMIYTTGVDDSITSINDAGVHLLGYDTPQELIGRQFSGLALNHEDRDYLLQRLELKHKVANYEIILLKKDGSPVFCLESTSEMKNETGRFIGLQGIVKNITDRIESERALWESNMDLASLNQKLRMTQEKMVQQEKLASIGLLAAGIAHEINNPLGFLKSNFETTRLILQDFQQYLESPHSSGTTVLDVNGTGAAFLEAFSDLDEIFRESEDGFNRIIRIVRDLKSFSQTHQVDVIDDIDLNHEVESAIMIAWNEIKYVAVVHTAPGIIPGIKGHKGELGQVILNMLINAAHAISSQKRPEKGTIEIQTLHTDAFVRLIILDDGPGIPKDVQSRIFDPFFTTKEPGEGTGLGLSISYDIIVNKYGGHLEVASEPGSGTQFTIDLPIHPVSRPGF